MQQRSAAYQAIFADPSHTLEWRVTINGTVYGEDRLVWNAGGSDSRPKIARSIFSGSQPEVGRAVAATFSCSVMEASGAIPRMASVIPACRLVLGEDASEWIPQGTFYIDTRTVDKVTGALTLSCYDRMLLADGAGGKSYAELTGFTTWPQPMSAVAAEIAEIMGVTLDSRTVIDTGSGYLVDYPSDYTMREVLGYIAAAHGGNWTITPANKLRLVPLPGTSDSFDLGAEAEGLKISPALQPWSGVTVYFGDEEAFESGDDTGRRLVCDCPWATQDTADGILAVISGSVYQPYTASGAVIDPALELGDVVTVGVAGDTVTGPVCSIDLAAGAIEQAEISAPGEDEIDHEYPYTSYVDRSLKRKVTLGASYYGTAISRERGLEISRSDGASRALFNSDRFEMSALIDGVMTPRIYFDPVKGDYIFDGALGADAVFTASLYAETGDVAELTVDRLSTSRRIRKYILGDKSDDNYVKIEDQYIRLITGTVNANIPLVTESGEKLGTEDEAYYLVEERKADEAPPVQAVNRYGSELYWMRQPVGHTSDGYPLDSDGVQIYATTDVTDWPIYVYDYVEAVKASFAFERDIGAGQYIPQITLGDGYEMTDADRGKGFLKKNPESFDLWLLTSEGEEHGMFIGDDYTDIVGLRKPTSIDFSGWDSGGFSATLDGDIENSWTVDFDASDRPVLFTDGDGHETEVIWE